jgi:hypothetical protein
MSRWLPCNCNIYVIYITSSNCNIYVIYITSSMALTEFVQTQQNKVDLITSHGLPQKSCARHDHHMGMNLHHIHCITGSSQCDGDQFTKPSISIEYLTRTSTDGSC